MGASIDFETRSFVDLPDTGAWRYAEDPSTELLCLGWKLDDGEMNLWVPGEEPPQLLLDAVERGEIITAHNAFFERCIWHFICHLRMGWPAVDPRQWRCSAAKAAAHSLPRKLGDAGKALRLPVVKDEEGKRIMLKMSKPRAMTLNNMDLYHNNEDDRYTTFTYCIMDVLAEEGINATLRDLAPKEQEVWFLDQKINAYGINVDWEAVTKAMILLEKATVRENERLTELTHGMATKVTQREAIFEWVQISGVNIPDLQKETLETWVNKPEVPENVRQVLEIRRNHKTSTAKYKALLDSKCSDGRIRDTLMYHGAHTGRWTGRLVQFQNLPRGDVKDMEALVADLKSLVFHELETKYGNVMTSLSWAIRGMIIPSPGMEFFVSDYAAVEARVLFWMADETKGIDIFKRGEDIYVDMAKDIYKKPINKKEHPKERQLGKTAILGLGFGMGANKFVATCEKQKIELSESFAKEVVGIYRNKFTKVVDFWYGVEACAIQAVKTKKPIYYRRLVFFMHQRFLFIKLPSGRCIAYCEPRVRFKETPWGELKETLFYWGVNPKTKQWQITHTYGGALTENCLTFETLVVTNNGIKMLGKISTSDLVWDGLNFVEHEGLICQGKKEVIDFAGIKITPDHKILTLQGWKKADVCTYTEAQAASSLPRHYRDKTWISNGLKLRGNRWSAISVDISMRMWNALYEKRFGIHETPEQTHVLRLQNKRIAANIKNNSRNVQTSSVSCLALNERQMSFSYPFCVSQVRASWHLCMQRMEERFFSLLERYGVGLSAGVDSRKSRQQRRVLKRELQMGNSNRTSEKYARKSVCGNSRGENAFVRSFRDFWDRYDNIRIPFRSQLANFKAFSGARPHQPNSVAPVYDLVNAGPLHRFTVLSKYGTPIIVSNCVQAIARDFLVESMLAIDAAGYNIVMHSHDEIVSERPIGEGSLEEYAGFMTTLPEWGAGCPIAEESWKGMRYRK